MDKSDLELYTAEDISKLILQMSALQVKTEITKFTPDQIKAAVQTLTDFSDTEWREKLAALIEGLTEYPALEAVGKALNLTQAKHILDEAAKTDKNGHWKLSPILVGMPHPLFSQLLISCTPSQLNTLKQEVITEAVQHHLTVLTHEITHQIPEFALKLEGLTLEIDQINGLHLGHAELKAITNHIDQCSQFYEKKIQLINQILTLAWNTNRTDLIEKLGTAKEVSMKLLGTIIGNRRTLHEAPTGLFAILESHLYQVFGDKENATDILANEDDEPAIEALVKFSLWYLKDYWDVGLLPRIKNSDELDIDANLNSHQERMEYREKLFGEVNENLKRIGLTTVGELKKNKIFSRKILEEYLTRHSHLLK
jgi:hypothetical protein